MGTIYIYLSYRLQNRSDGGSNGPWCNCVCANVVLSPFTCQVLGNLINRSWKQPWYLCKLIKPFWAETFKYFCYSRNIDKIYLWSRHKQTCEVGISGQLQRRWIWYSLFLMLSRGGVRVDTDGKETQSWFGV